MRHRKLLPVMLVALWAGQAPLAGEAEPLVSFDLPSMARTIERLDATPFGRLWADPAMAPLRAKVEAELAKASARDGVDAMAVMRAATKVHLRIDRIALGAQGQPMPTGVAQLDAGAQTPALWRLIAAQAGTSAVRVPGADAALRPKAKPDAPPMTAARFGSLLALAFGDAVPAPAALRPIEADLRGQLDIGRILDALAAGMPEPARANLARVRARQPELFAPITLTTTVVADGFRERVVQRGAGTGLRPVERSALAPLPGTTLMALAMGVDGAGWWNGLGTLLIEQAAADQQRPAAELLAEADQQLAAMGIRSTLAQLVSGISGTVVVAITPAAPFPAVTVMIPRSPALDQAVGALLTAMGAAAPAAGALVPLPLPDGAPVAVSLGQGAGHWLVSTDMALATTALTGAAGGYLDSAAAKRALAAAPAGAWVLGSSDTPAVLRVLAQYASIIPGMEAKDKQALVAGLGKLAGWSKPGYVWSGLVDGDRVTETQGLIAGMLLPMVAAVAVPSLIESRSVAQEAAAAATLRSGVFPSLTQFQTGGYRDLDADGRGEYGVIGQLAGDVHAAGPKRPLSFLDPALAGVDPVKNGYHFRVVVPTAPDAGSHDPDAIVAAAKADPTVCDLQEDHCVAYAWPTDPSQGRRMFALDYRFGTIYVAPASGTAPAAMSLRPRWDAEIPADGPWVPYRK